MIIEVVDEVFEGVQSELELYQLFRLAFEERHVLLTEPLWDHPSARALQSWLADQRPEVREILELVLEQSIRVMATGPSPAHQRKIRVVQRSTPRWDAAPPELPLAQACRLAEAPLKVLVENRRNDAAFLRACIPPSLRKRLDHAEEQGWLEFEMGGGLPEMIHRVRTDGRRGQEHRAARLAVVYDSDARADYDPATGETKHDDRSARMAWGPSADANEMARVCERAAGRPFSYRLRRRSIENYVPGKILEAWARGRSERFKVVKAYLSMSAEQRHYFNMKRGLAGDSNSGRSPIYVDLSAGDEAALQHGFGSLAEFFHEREFRIEPHWLNDGQIDEIGKLLENIIGLV